MKVSEWKTYRTRFLVKAKQLDSSLSFTDHLGRQHCGGKGDYLVESYDGVISIAPRRIFEDIYVPMTGFQKAGAPSLAGDAPGLPGFARPGKTELDQSCTGEENAFSPSAAQPLDLPTVRVEPLQIGRIKPAAFRYGPRDSTRSGSDLARVRRKSATSAPSAVARVPLM